MVLTPFTPLVCAMLTTLALTLTFYVGKWWGMKMTMNLIEKEIEKGYKRRRRRTVAAT